MDRRRGSGRQEDLGTFWIKDLGYFSGEELIVGVSIGMMRENKEDIACLFISRYHPPSDDIPVQGESIF